MPWQGHLCPELMLSGIEILEANTLKSCVGRDGGAGRWEIEGATGPGSSAAEEASRGCCDALCTI
jgi:hypothetical protein